MVPVPQGRGVVMAETNKGPLLLEVNSYPGLEGGRHLWAWPRTIPSGNLESIEEPGGPSDGVFRCNRSADGAQHAEKG